MTLEQALLRIIELQDEVANLKQQLQEANGRASLTSLSDQLLKKDESPWTIKRISEDTCQHEYPNPWFGVTPPCCKKCGQIAQQMLTVTCDTKPLFDGVATISYPLVLKTNG